ncbi:serine O-acetyltransferase [Aliivibrio fischeri]|uniref:serine O-acetyltransferase n=1 Tax=Aliivibrio fischeri TaxID=668 RepID=UPI0012D8BD8A|nr:hypothetical protein [Aliivibrio fischeri]
MRFYIPSVQLVLLYRFYHFLYKYKFTKPISYLFYFISRIVYASDIHPAALIGANFSIRHHFSIVIGKRVVIGDNCIIYNGVSIGQRSIRDNRMPLLGDNIILYKGATVCGSGKLPDNTIVGANKVIILK